MVKETFGLDYERFALTELQKQLAKELSIKTVLEVPASGIKAMPSIYSLGFGAAGCKVFLVNAAEKSKKAWRELNYDVEFIDAKDIGKLPFPADSFDFVWNYNSLSLYKNYKEILAEMKRVSGSLVSLFCVNGHNYGQISHKLVHAAKKIPWTHGDKRFFYPKGTLDAMRQAGIRIKKFGVVDCPPWPDSPGFRDVKMHKIEKIINEVDWESNTVNYLKHGTTPNWIKRLYKFEKIKVPMPIKLIYSHIYYFVGEK